jgi:hypothetical protein
MWAVVLLVVERVLVRMRTRGVLVKKRAAYLVLVVPAVVGTAVRVAIALLVVRHGSGAAMRGLAR